MALKNDENDTVKLNLMHFIDVLLFKEDINGQWDSLFVVDMSCHFELQLVPINRQFFNIKNCLLYQFYICE